MNYWGKVTAIPEDTPQQNRLLSKLSSFPTKLKALVVTAISLVHTTEHPARNAD